MVLNKVHQRLKENQQEFYGYNNFTGETMSRIENQAMEMKPIAVYFFDKEDEVTGKLESVILISKKYHTNTSIEPEIEIIIGALRHLEYGLALFLEKIELKEGKSCRCKTNSFIFDLSRFFPFIISLSYKKKLKTDAPLRKQG